MLPDLSRREELVELMDSTRLEDEELDQTLSFLASIDRYVGGRSVILGHLSRWLAGWPADRPATILDVGTGGADLPVALARWAKGRGLRLKITGLDSDARIAGHARRRAAAEPAVEVVEAGLLDFARAGRRFDFVISSLTLHHIPDKALVPALQACDALAERGVLISDLRRCALGFIGAKALTALAGNRVTRNDGPVSVRRAFTAPELADLARRAGLPYLKVRSHFGFRLSLAGQKDG